MMIFPNGANEYERNLGWRRLDAGDDIDFNDINSAEYGVLAVLAKGDDVCVIKSGKIGFLRLPGGTIEDNESLEAALRRVVLEKAGYTAREIESLGYVCQRVGDQGIKVWFIFAAKADKDVGTNYTREEVLVGFEPAWLSFDGAIDAFRNDAIGADAERDLAILECIKKGIADE